ncbi:hypothetical protein ZIOFF_026802 [Zingiber officinale]|uniref:Histone-lysine N-methyltransferase ASHH3 n=1 Tax=Zingiber officinale TaxID=94328 RepID=A0A8J5H4H6_ZINOF|nr:hypothetical protein ZIOFF_026802 [Zingiber officinale]
MRQEICLLENCLSDLLIEMIRVRDGSESGCEIELILRSSLPLSPLESISLSSPPSSSSALRPEGARHARPQDQVVALHSLTPKIAMQSLNAEIPFLLATSDILNASVTFKDERQSIEHIFEKLSKELNDQVDFDLPTWLKKGKPAPYISIKRNFYLTKRRIEDDGIFCSCTPLSGSSIVCGGDCHCGVLFSCCTSSCKCGDKCLNKSFQYREQKKMKVVQTEKCGFGLVSEEDIKQGDFVIEYVGEVLDDKACEERLWKMKDRRDTNFYLCEVNHDMVIDATYKGNKSRFINHSCEPNTEMQKWRADGETRVGIFARRNIRKGEEVTYDYQFVQFGADQVCLCGTPRCRQKLGNKPKSSSSDDQRRKSKNENCIGELVRVWLPSDKRYIGGFISDFDNISGKHTIKFVDDHEEVLDMSNEDWDFL